MNLFKTLIFVFIAPANAEMSAWTATSIPADWTQWRNQWEVSHAASFVLHLLGFGALLFSTLLETPSRSGTPRLVRRRSLTAYRKRGRCVHYGRS